MAESKGGISGDSEQAAVPWDALRRCQAGENLLKFGRQGEPHFRKFFLSKDYSTVKWQSKGKTQVRYK